MPLCRTIKAFTALYIFYTLVIMTSKTLLFFLFTINCFAKCTPQQKVKAPIPQADSLYSYKNPSADGIGKFYLGREISQVMGAGGSGWLERPDRNQEENTDLTIEKISLPPNAVIADIGAGSGYYAFKLVAKVPRGKVYAVEIQDELISLLQNKKIALKDSVVEVRKGSSLSPNLPDNSIDLAVLVDVYHELEFPHEMLRAIRRSLKKDGKILLIEYRGEDPSVPIKALHKTTIAQLSREMAASGFQLHYKGSFLPIQHFLLYQKK